MVNPVTIELKEEEVHRQTDSEKLTSLVRIAFANHQLLDEHGKILFGNGDPTKGLCYKTNLLASKINWFMGITTTGGGIIIGLLVKHIMG